MTPTERYIPPATSCPAFPFQYEQSEGYVGGGLTRPPDGMVGQRRQPTLEIVRHSCGIIDNRQHRCRPSPGAHVMLIEEARQFLSGEEAGPPARRIDDLHQFDCQPGLADSRCPRQHSHRDRSVSTKPRSQIANRRFTTDQLDASSERSDYVLRDRKTSSWLPPNATKQPLSWQQLQVRQPLDHRVAVTLDLDNDTVQTRRAGLLHC